MGQFSWIHAENGKNFIPGDAIKMLIPKKFDVYGPGYIKGHYDGYGHIIDKQGNEYDVFHIIAVINKNYLYKVKDWCWEDKKDVPITADNPYIPDDIDRVQGINIACLDRQQEDLQYQIKLVSPRYKGTYETCLRYSKLDPDQGFSRKYYR